MTTTNAALRDWVADSPTHEARPDSVVQRGDAERDD
jgi:hypothetical protein